MKAGQQFIIDSDALVEILANALMMVENATERMVKHRNEKHSEEYASADSQYDSGIFIIEKIFIEKFLRHQLLAAEGGVTLQEFIKQQRDDVYDFLECLARKL